jgi:hypothetical protein
MDSLFFKLSSTKSLKDKEQTTTMVFQIFMGFSVLLRTSIKGHQHIMQHAGNTKILFISYPSGRLAKMTYYILMYAFDDNFGCQNENEPRPVRESSSFSVVRVAY